MAAWPYIAASTVIHIGYYIALTGAYKHGDLGLTYPLMRGVGPVLVALSATLTLGETLTPVAWAGVLGVCSGVLVLGLSRHALEQPKAVAFALTNAVIIAVYTVVDALGARAAVQNGGNVFQYVAMLFVLDGWPFALIVLRQRGMAVALAVCEGTAAGGFVRGCRLGRLLRHCAVGHDACAGGHRGRSARNVRAVCCLAGQLVSERSFHAPPRPGHGRHRRRRDGLETGMTP